MHYCHFMVTESEDYLSVSSEMGSPILFSTGVAWAHMAYTVSSIENGLRLLDVKESVSLPSVKLQHTRWGYLYPHKLSS